MLLLLSQPLFGHGDLEERILAKTAAIAQEPENAGLYLERGFLYQQHEELDKALADYLQAQQLGLEDKVLYYRIAETYLALELPQSGLLYTQYYLQQDALDVKIHHLRGELFFRAKAYEKAITAFRFVLDNAHDLNPDNYLTLAAVYWSKNSEEPDSVLLVLEEGLQKLGSRIFTLQEQKLYYLQQFGQVKAALQQYDLILQQLNRKERWHYKKAHYLYEQGHYQAAHTSLQAAQAAFEQLKPHQQKTKAMIALLAKIHQLSQKIER